MAQLWLGFSCFLACGRKSELPTSRLTKGSALHCGPTCLARVISSLDTLEDSCASHSLDVFCLKIITATMGSVFSRAENAAHSDAFDTRESHPRKCLLFERCFRAKTLRTVLFVFMLYKEAIMCTERQKCCKHQCGGIFAKGTSTCDRVCCSIICCIEQEK